MKPEAVVPNAAPNAAALRAVARAIGELRRGDPVLLHGSGGEAALILAVETARPESLSWIVDAGSGQSFLLLTERRAAALDLSPAGGRVTALPAGGLDLAALMDLADPVRENRPQRPLSLVPSPALGEPAVDIVKLARLLPAAAIAPIGIEGGDGPASRQAWVAEHDLLVVSAADIAEYRFAGQGALTQVAEARLPLAGAENARVAAFRPSDGGKAHLAIIIGTPQAGDSVLVRVHSECFTGDLLGSLRCDCGDQLRGAIEAIARAGSGVLLYLSQEGRGIGLVNKLRAYQVQDDGADTAEANEALGFDADERIYLPAAAMLQHLGLRRVRLLTNNPNKVSALSRCGITVEERVPHAFPANGHNEFYLATKAARFGHHI